MNLDSMYQDVILDHYKEFACSLDGFDELVHFFLSVVEVEVQGLATCGDCPIEVAPLSPDPVVSASS